MIPGLDKIVHTLLAFLLLFFVCLFVCLFVCFCFYGGWLVHIEIAFITDVHFWHLYYTNVERLKCKLYVMAMFIIT